MVEQGGVEPGVAGSVSGSPDHSGEPGQFLLGHHCRQRVSGTAGRAARPIPEAVFVDVGVDAIQQSGLLEIGRLDQVGQRSGELGAAAGHPDETTGELDACRRQAARSRVRRCGVPASCSDGSLRALARSSTSS